jgi:LysR family cyn operon transcriptional activator
LTQNDKERQQKIMELRHLRYFIAAAELENFTKAAESLYVSQPTLSVQIHQLEKELGTELFVRSGRNVRLTQTGRVFLQRAKQAVKELEEGGKEVDALSGLIRGNLTVGALPMFGSQLVAHWFADFNERYPNVNVHGRSAAGDDLELEVLAGRVDIGFGILPLSHAELSFHELFEEEIVVIASKHHALAEHPQLTLDDLREVPMALPSQRISASQAMGKYFEEHYIEPNSVITYDDGHALLQIVLKGKFITFLPGWAVRHHPDLVVLPLPDTGIPIKSAAFWTHLSPAAQAFLEIAKQGTAPSPHAQEGSVRLP